MAKNKKTIVVSSGEKCPKCKIKMERRIHNGFESIKNKAFYYLAWDVCTKCKHVKHYDKFKCPRWNENQQGENWEKIQKEQEKFLKTI